MILLIHKNAETPVRILKDGVEVAFKSDTCTGAFWEMAERFPDKLIGWCEEDLQEKLALENWGEIFHHDLIMASYAVKIAFLPPQLGYVDQLPFINVNRNILYGTWQMSSDVGGIKGKVLLQFRKLFSEERNFNFLLNSIGKIGQQNSLFCYSVPELICQAEPAEASINYARSNRQTEPESPNNTNQVNQSSRQTELVEARDSSSEPNNSPAELVEAPVGYFASTSQLFTFVYQHYNSAWTSVLLLSYIIYERSFPFFTYLKCFRHGKFFKKEVDFSGIEVASGKIISKNDTVDVIIPTIGRPEYLMDVLKDLAAQTHLPEKVIIVEQNPDKNSASELNFLQTEAWPFEIIHHFIHQTGACNARNIALKEATSEWIFFADDDIRFNEKLLQNVLMEIQKFGISAVHMNCKQEDEKTVFHKVKQWGSFGSGTSIVSSQYAKKCQFSMVYEHGNGEDADFGMQLRKLGCDIIYHPQLELFHLKAPIGGFRKNEEKEWENDASAPKPSPTIMAFAERFYSLEQIRGYKISLFLKYYQYQEIKNPVKYLRTMNRRWKKSKEWSGILMERLNNNN